MIKAQTFVFCALLMPGLALAQEGYKTPAEDAPQTQKIETQESQSSKEGMNQKQAEGEQKASVDQKPADGVSSGEMFMTEQTDDQILSDQLVGTNIVNASDEKIGSIDSLIMDQDGQVVGIIVGVGGFLGMGEKRVALSWDSVEITKAEDETRYQVKTTIGKEELENATAYKTERRQQAEQQQLEQQQQQPLNQQQPQDQPQQ